MNQDQISILLFIVVSHIVLSIFCVYIGIQIGKTLSINNQQYEPKLFGSKSQYEQTGENPITIDTKKVVLGIDTNSLTKKFDKIADKKQTIEKIDSSINKLKNMKG
jgi:hypothetical protein